MLLVLCGPPGGPALSFLSSLGDSGWPSCHSLEVLGESMGKLSAHKWHSLFPSTLHDWSKQVIWPYLTSHHIPREPKYLWPGLRAEQWPLWPVMRWTAICTYATWPPAAVLLVLLIAFHSLYCLPRGQAASRYSSLPLVCQPLAALPVHFRFITSDQQHNLQPSEVKSGSYWERALGTRLQLKCTAFSA